MIDFADMKGKWVKIDFAMKAYDKRAEKPFINMVIRGTLDDTDNDLIKVTDIKGKKNIIRKSDIISMYTISHMEAMEFMEKESNKSALGITVKNFDKKLQNFQENKLKKDIEWLDKKIKKVRKDIKK